MSCLLSDFTTEAIDEFARARRAMGLRASYINTDLTVLGAILRWGRASTEKLGGGLPAPDAPYGPFSPCAMQELGGGRQAARDRAQARPGARAADRVPAQHGAQGRSESIAARWDWVDERARMLRIPVTDEWRRAASRATCRSARRCGGCCAGCRSRRRGSFRRRQGVAAASSPTLASGQCVARRSSLARPTRRGTRTPVTSCRPCRTWGFWRASLVTPTPARRSSTPTCSPGISRGPGTR